MNALLRFFSVLPLVLGLAPSALALNPGDRVENFRLLDQNGASHELCYLSDARAVVIMVHGNGCPIVRNTVPGLKEIRDRSISNEDAKTLVHWIEAGAPRGTGRDLLVALDTKWSEWTLGNPDLIVEVPAYDVPATGVVSYQYPVERNPMGRDVWIRAIEILPGDRSVVHHVLAGIDDPGNGERRAIRGQIGELGGYAPGKNAALYPADTGIFLRKEANFRYSQSLEQVFDRDVMLYSLLPHAHLRGRAARFTAHYPDGGTEILLSVPKYDFNWQPLYVLTPSKLIPAGTRVVLDMTWDNSAQNPANPDPTQVVRWGDQTWEEMNVGWFRFREADDDDRAATAALKAGRHSAARSDFRR